VNCNLNIHNYNQYPEEGFFTWMLQLLLSFPGDCME
jgi:hypothetical protein